MRVPAPPVPSIPTQAIQKISKVTLIPGLLSKGAAACTRVSEVYVSMCHLVVIQVIEGSNDGYHAGVLAIHMFDALEGVWRILLHE